MGYITIFTERISIHALREEGDYSLPTAKERRYRFLSTPSARRATSKTGRQGAKGHYFYPRPPRGGRLANLGEQAILKKISIHALREEGDIGPITRQGSKTDFYPRPPRGGRRIPGLVDHH